MDQTESRRGAGMLDVGALVCLIILAGSAAYMTLAWAWHGQDALSPQLMGPTWLLTGFFFWAGHVSLPYLLIRASRSRGGVATTARRQRLLAVIQGVVLLLAWVAIVQKWEL